MINILSNILWLLFIPFIIVMGIYVIYKYIVSVRSKIETEQIKVSKIIGQISISLGTMIGTGAIIGILGSISSLYLSGQEYFEAIVFWAIIGSLVLVPLAYLETIVAKTMHMNPKEYISVLLSKKAAIVYALAFCLLHIFGFCGFQIQGINSAITIITDGFFDINLTQIQRFLLIVVPLLIFVGIIILTKKHDVFINAMSFFIGIAVILYFIFAILFVLKTNNYVNIFLGNIFKGVTNPVTSLIGIPLGMVASFQRICQSSEPGLGAFALSSLDNDVKAKPAAAVSALSATITVFVAIFITTYIMSYANYTGQVNLQVMDSLQILTGFFYTAYNILGYFGVFTLTIFTIFSGITTILGSYYFLKTLFKLSFIKEFSVYMLFLILAGIFAIFGTDFIFNLIDLLMFIVAFINVVTIFIFIKKFHKIKPKK
ncbi:MAG: alanine:cation symporter family protein [Mycoplasmatales bacterium]